MRTGIERKEHVRAATAEREKRQEHKYIEEHPHAVKEMLDAIQVFHRAIEKTLPVARAGKFSPTDKRFTRQGIDDLIGQLNELNQILEEEGEARPSTPKGGTHYEH
jgi:soluble cytochrome b562